MAPVNVTVVVTGCIAAVDTLTRGIDACGALATGGAFEPDRTTTPMATSASANAMPAVIHLPRAVWRKPGGAVTGMLAADRASFATRSLLIHVTGSVCSTLCSGLAPTVLRP